MLVTNRRVADLHQSLGEQNKFCCNYSSFAVTGVLLILFMVTTEDRSHKQDRRYIDCITNGQSLFDTELESSKLRANATDAIELNRPIAMLCLPLPTSSFKYHAVLLFSSITKN